MPKRRAPTHAGGVVVRESSSGPEYLVVEASSNPGMWVLPKGRIEAGESPEEAAVREVQEEAGCRAAIVKPVGSIEFDSIKVEFFLMRYERDVPSDEDREISWGGYEKTRRRLSFEDIREILARAHAFVTDGG
jgi:8-oxo-dGTP pyrophosphatase MutT (NUDIX family)